MRAKLIREILELHYFKKLSQDAIARAARTSKGSVNKTIKRAAGLGITSITLEEMGDRDLESRFYPKPIHLKFESEPDFEKLLDELVKPAVTVQLLWEEYQQSNPDGMKRSTFFSRIKEIGSNRDQLVSMHQTPKGGRYLQVDYSGLKASYFDADRNENVEVEIFVASWAASSYVYAEAAPSQKKEDWIQSNVRALRYFGCSPDYIVPDNLKSGVIKANFYDPTLNLAYAEMAKHYGSVILPTRARRPQDKASVESNVRFVQNFILGSLRNQRFNSLRELNEGIWKRLTELNDRPMQRYKVSRKERFQKLDCPHANALPQTDFKVLEIKPQVKVEKDHHVIFKNHSYSVPWRYTGSRVDVWLVENLVYIYSDGERVATHSISNETGGYTTEDQHRPPNHLFVKNLKPMWVLAKAEEIGPRTHTLIKNLIDDDPTHCELAIRKGLGLIELSRDHTPERVEKAVIKALNFSRLQLQEVKSLLEQGLEGKEITTAKTTTCIHSNIRGAEHYNNIQKQGG